MTAYGNLNQLKPTREQIITHIEEHLPRATSHSWLKEQMAILIDYAKGLELQEQYLMERLKKAEGVKDDGPIITRASI